jgi:hypothetical protein
LANLLILLLVTTINSIAWSKSSVAKMANFLILHNKDHTMTLTIPYKSDSQRSSPLCLLFVIASLMLMVSGCASNHPPPNKSIWAAEAAIESAERSRVSEYAAAELVQARDYLSRANLAVTQKHMENAEQFAQQSLVTTQLAVARAELIKAKAINVEMSKSIAQLDQEMQHNERVNP